MQIPIFMSKDTSSNDPLAQLHAGIEAARSGNVDEAQTLLQAVLAQDSENVPALLWLAFIAADPSESISLIKQALTIEPDNEQAQSGLRWAESRLQQAESGDAPADIDAEELPNLRQQLFSSGSQEEGRKNLLAQRARRNINPFHLILLPLLPLVEQLSSTNLWV